MNRKYVFIIVVTLILNKANAQNPLLYSFFHEAYPASEMVQYGNKVSILDNKLSNYLCSTNKLEEKIAAIDALFVGGSDADNGRLFELFLENKYGTINSLTAEHKFILGYLYAPIAKYKSEHYFEACKSYYSSSKIYHIIKLISKIHHDVENDLRENHCISWQEFQQIDNNKSYKNDINENAINLIAKEIDELKIECSAEQLVLTKTKREFPKESKYTKRFKLNEVGGVYSIELEINGELSLDFIYDSGASSVLIPEDVFRVLVRTKTITKSDMRGTQKFSIADGSIIEKPIFILKSLKLGDIIVYDIEASVGNIDSDLLLGQSFQKQFKQIKIDNIEKTLIVEEYPTDNNR